MIIPIIEVIQTYLFVSCFLKRKVRFGKVLDWLVLIGVSEVGTIGNHYFQDANINILIAVIEIIILLSFFEGGVKRKILAGLLYLVFAFLAEVLWLWGCQEHMISGSVTWEIRRRQ